MALRDLREAVRAELATDLAIEFDSGPPLFEGGITRRSRGYVWAEGIVRADAGLWEEAEIHARLYLKLVEPRSDEDSVDPQPLEDAAEALRDAIANRKRLTAAGGVWLLRFVSVEIDYVSQFAELIIRAGIESPYELAETTG